MIKLKGPVGPWWSCMQIEKLYVTSNYALFCFTDSTFLVHCVLEHIVLKCVNEVQSVLFANMCTGPTMMLFLSGRWSEMLRIHEVL